MRTKPFGLLELGSNSLKFYRVERAQAETYRIATHKIPWRVAHDFFSGQTLHDESVEEILSALREVKTMAADLEISGMLSLATGVFREISDINSLAERIKKESGLRLRVISGKDEAKLMARGFKAKSSGSVVLGDLGGATTEWAWIEGGRTKSWGSLRLGAIRQGCLLRELEDQPESYLEKGRELCDLELRGLPVETKSALLFTGGTAKALANTGGNDDISREDLKAVIREVLKGGAPESLEPSRREVYLPGLIILERLMARCQAPSLKYSRTSVREGMASRLVDLLDKKGGRHDLHSTLLLHTSSSGPD